MFTKDKHTILEYDLRQLTRDPKNNTNPAYKQLSRDLVHDLGVKPTFTIEQMNSIAANNECHEHVYKKDGEKHNVDPLVTDVLLPNVVSLMHDYMPSLFQSAFGFVGRWTPNFIKRMGKSIYNNRVVLGLATAIYTMVKLLVCLYFSPSQGAKQLATFVAEQSGIPSKYVEGVVKALTTVASCATLSWQCVIDIGKTAFSQVAVIGKYFGKIWGYFIGSTGLTDFADITVNGSYNMLDNKGSWGELVFGSSYTAGAYQNIRGSMESEVVEAMKNNSLAPIDVQTALVTMVLPTIGLKVLKFLSAILGKVIPGFDTVVKKLTTALMSSRPLMAIHELINGLVASRALFLLASFWWRETQSIVSCAMGGKDCCFSTGYRVSSKIARVTDEAYHRKVKSKFGYNETDGVTGTVAGFFGY
jgi:hypothetical protein